MMRRFYLAVRIPPDGIFGKDRSIDGRLRAIFGQIAFFYYAHMRLCVALDLILKFTAGIFR